MTPKEKHDIVVQAAAIDKMPRFAVGATVWILANKLICCTTIQSITYQFKKGWHYTMDMDNYITLHAEDFVFGHLDELIDALTE